MPTIWNLNPQNFQANVPYKNVHIPSESSFTVLNNIISPVSFKEESAQRNECLMDKTRICTPSAALDLSKPVLSLRKEVKEELDQSLQSSMIKYYNKLVSQKEAFETKSIKKEDKETRSSMKNRISTAVASNKGSISFYPRKRVMTKEGKRKKLFSDTQQIETSKSRSKSRSKDFSQSPNAIRPTSKEKSLHLSKIDEKRPSLRVKKRRINTGCESIKKDQCEQKNKSGERSKERKKANKKKQSLKKRKSTSKGRISPSRRKYPKIHERKDNIDKFGSQNPMNRESGGIFGINLDDASIQDIREFGINIRGSPSTFSGDGVEVPKHKIEVIDWANTELFKMVLNGDTELNKNMEKKYFLRDELDYIIEMMQKRYKDFKSNDLLKPFFK